MLRKFGKEVDEKDEKERKEKDNSEKSPENPNKLKVNLVSNFESLGESWKVGHMGTQLPSSVVSRRKSAAVRARGAQFLKEIRPDNMSEGKDGQSKRIKGKRKLNEIEENGKISDYFSPKKLPKINNEKTFSSRLGGDPGEGSQQ